MTTVERQLFGQNSFLASTMTNYATDCIDKSAQLDDGTRVDMPFNGVLQFTPTGNADDPLSVLISCGVHGNETAPMELVDRLLSDIFSGLVRVNNRLMIVLGNPRAAVVQKRFVEENLNRLFMGRHAGADVCDSIEGKRAALLEKCTAGFFNATLDHRVHYDLHTAIRGSRHEKFAVYPFLHDRQWVPGQLAFLEKCGIEAVLLSNQPSTTYSYYTSTEFNADAFTVELGSVKPFGENDLIKFSAMEQQLRLLTEGGACFDGEPHDLAVYAVVAEITKRSDTMQFGFSDDVDNFTAYRQGTVLATDEDFSYRVKQDGESIVFPLKDVPVGHRVALVVAPHKI